MSLSVRGQLLLDDFNRPDNATVGNGWSEVSTILFSNNSRITSGSLQVIASNTSAVGDLSYQKVDTYNTVLSANTDMLTWACNMRQTVNNPEGFNSSSSNGIGFILGFQSTFFLGLPAAPYGYAVVLGQPGTTDPIRLVHFNDIGNSGLTPIISSGDYSNEFLSIRVTYNPVGNLWSLFVESSPTGYPRSDPRLTATQAGTTVPDATYTNENLEYVGLDWHHNVSTPDYATFDDVYVPNNFIFNYFRSKQSGDWSAASTWEMSSNNVIWENATLSPTAESNAIIIQNTHTVALSSSVAIDQTTIQSGGILHLADGTLALSDGAGEDLTIAPGGIFQHGNGSNTAVNTPTGTGTIRVSNGGTIQVITGTGDQADHYANSEDPDLASRVTWESNAIFDWNTPFSLATSGVTYFPNVTSATAPILKISQSQSNLGGGLPTSIHGVVEANASTTWQGTGTKTFRNGLRGTGNVSQNAGSGAFLISGPQAELSGTGVISLSTNGMQISASNVACSISKTISASAASVISLEGGASQQIGGTGTLTFSTNTTLDVRNNVLLAGNIIANNLTFTAGKLSLTTNNLTIHGTIAGVNSSKYIVTRDDKASAGFLTRNVGATLTSFPIGTATSYTPVSISNTTGTIAFQARVFNNIFVNGTAGNMVTSLNDAVRKTWEITPTGSANASLLFTWNVSDEGNNFAASTSMRTSVGVFRNPVSTAPNNTWAVLPNATIVAGSNPYSLTVSGITTFSTFALASPFVALPVTLLSFTGQRNNGLVLLEWITSTEKDNAGFEVQRSENARDFTVIGFVKPDTITSSLSSYRFKDERLSGGPYYRLRQVDIDGRYEYSKIIFVPSNTSVSLYPNPTRGPVFLRLPTQESTKLGLFTIQGTSVSSFVGLPAQVNQHLNDQLSDLPSGLYFLQIEQGHEQYFFRLVKE